MGHLRLLRLLLLLLRLRLLRLRLRHLPINRLFQSRMQHCRWFVMPMMSVMCLATTLILKVIFRCR